MGNLLQDPLSKQNTDPKSPSTLGVNVHPFTQNTSSSGRFSEMLNPERWPGYEKIPPYTQVLYGLSGNIFRDFVRQFDQWSWLIIADPLDESASRNRHVRRAQQRISEISKELCVYLLFRLPPDHFLRSSIEERAARLSLTSHQKLEILQSLDINVTAKPIRPSVRDTEQSLRVSQAVQKHRETLDHSS